MLTDRGVYLVDGVPAVFTAGTKYAVIDLEPDRMKIALYDRWSGRPVKPETWIKNFRNWTRRWLKPYAGDERVVVDP